MKFLRLLLITLITVLAITVFSQNITKTKEPEQPLLNREVTLPELRYVETSTIFQKALLTAKVPGGVVSLSCNVPLKWDFVASHITTLEAFLINLEQTDINYKWQLNNGVLNLLPQQKTPKLLKTPIKRFNVKNVTAQEALNLLQEKPEVKRKKIELGLDKAVISINKATAFSPENEQNVVPTFDLNLKEATFQQILNEIVRAHGRAIWIYTEKHCADTIEFSIILVE